MKVYGVVYLIIDGTNNREYVGQATKPLEARIMQHKRSEPLRRQSDSKVRLEKFPLQRHQDLRVERGV